MQNKLLVMHNAVTQDSSCLQSRYSQLSIRQKRRQKKAQQTAQHSVASYLPGRHGGLGSGHDLVHLAVLLLARVAQVVADLHVVLVLQRHAVAVAVALLVVIKPRWK